jgi:hypothetical protein
LPTDSEWPGFTKYFNQVYPDGLPNLHCDKRTEQSKGSLKQYFGCLERNAQNVLADEETLEILEFMLKINPRDRPTAEQVLKHRFFADCPEVVELPFGKNIKENEAKTIELDDSPQL